MKKFLLFILALLFLVGCSKVNPLPSTSVTTEPSETEIIATQETDLREFQELLSYHDNGNWIPFTLGCIFEKPQDVDLDFMFYSGTTDLGWHSISSASEEELINAGFWREMDLQVMPVSSLNEALKETLGITLADAKIPVSWYYLSSEDAYCSNNNDAYYIGPVTVTSVTKYSDGTAEVHYQVGSCYNTKTHEFLGKTCLILTLYQDGTRWLVYSNLIESVG